MTVLATIQEPRVYANKLQLRANDHLKKQDLPGFLTAIVNQFTKWSIQKRRKDSSDLVKYLESILGLRSVEDFYARFSKDEEHGLDSDKLQILPCERSIKMKLLKFFVHAEPGLWEESIEPVCITKGTNPILKPHQEEPYSYSPKSFLQGPFAIVRSALDKNGQRIALKEYSSLIDVSYDIMIQNMMLPHPNGLKTLCTYRTTRTGKVIQKMAMQPWCDYRLEDIITAGDYSIDLVLRIAYCLGSLLYHTHCHGVKHVNINPRNILLTDSGSIYLADLSTSRIYTEDEYEEPPDEEFPRLQDTTQQTQLTPRPESENDARTDRGRLVNPVSVSTMSNFTIQTDLFYTSPEQKVDVSRRGTDIWMLGVTLLELLYNLAPQEREIRHPDEIGYMVAALPTHLLRSKLRELPSLHDAKEEALRREIVAIVEEVLVQQPRDRPSAYTIHQRLANFAKTNESPLELIPEPDLGPIEAAKDIIRAKIPYSVHEHTTVKGEDDALVDLKQGSKKVRFGNDFHVDVFVTVAEGDEDGNEISEQSMDEQQSNGCKLDMAKAKWSTGDNEEDGQTAEISAYFTTSN